MKTHCCHSANFSNYEQLSICRNASCDNFNEITDLEPDSTRISSLIGAAGKKISLFFSLFHMNSKSTAHSHAAHA